MLSFYSTYWVGMRDAQQRLRFAAAKPNPRNTVVVRKHEHFVIGSRFNSTGVLTLRIGLLRILSSGFIKVSFFIWTLLRKLLWQHWNFWDTAELKGLVDNSITRISPKDFFEANYGFVMKNLCSSKVNEQHSTRKTVPMEKLRWSKYGKKRN